MAVIGIPTAVIQICLSVAASLTNISAAALPQSDEIIAAYGVVQRLILIGCYAVMGFMQGYQPVTSYAFGAKNEERFHQSVRFALKGGFFADDLSGSNLYPSVKASDAVVQSKPGHRGLWPAAADLSGGALSGLRTMLYDDHYLPDHRGLPIWAVPLTHPPGTVLCSLHPDPAQATGGNGHLSLPASGGHFNDRMCSVKSMRMTASHNMRISQAENKGE